MTDFQNDNTVSNKNGFPTLKGITTPAQDVSRQRQELMNHMRDIKARVAARSSQLSKSNTPDKAQKVAVQKQLKTSLLSPLQNQVNSLKRTQQSFKYDKQDQTEEVSMLKKKKKPNTEQQTTMYSTTEMVPVEPTNPYAESTRYLVPFQRTDSEEEPIGFDKTLSDADKLKQLQRRKALKIVSKFIKEDITAANPGGTFVNSVPETPMPSKSGFGNYTLAKKPSNKKPKAGSFVFPESTGFANENGVGPDGGGDGEDMSNLSQTLVTQTPPVKDTPKPKKKNGYKGIQFKESVELSEVLLNDRIKPTTKFKGTKFVDRNIDKIKTGWEWKKPLHHIGTTTNGIHIFHGKAHDGLNYYFGTTNNGDVKIHLSTANKGKAEHIKTVQAIQGSGGVHNLYHHLITKHNKILTTDEQSEGGKRVWEKLHKLPGVNIHGYDPRTGKANSVDLTGHPEETHIEPKKFSRLTKSDWGKENNKEDAKTLRMNLVAHKKLVENIRNITTKSLNEDIEFLKNPGLRYDTYDQALTAAKHTAASFTNLNDRVYIIKHRYATVSTLKPFVVVNNTVLKSQVPNWKDKGYNIVAWISLKDGLVVKDGKNFVKSEE